MIAMFVERVVRGPLETIGYLAYDRPGGKALVVDTPLGSTRWYTNALSNKDLELVYIVNTHGHWDHIADNLALVKATGAKLCAHVWDATRLANPMLATENEQPLPVPPSKADINVHDEQVLEVGECRFTVLHTPGHSPGSVCLYEEQVGAVFTGDTLGRHRASRTEFPGGNLAQLCESYIRLAGLPDDTKVYPGHGPLTTIREERWLLELALQL
jgi:glyoxylase-like metal-dependent hydrolase (beta-lactamase superfamily II)